MTKHVKNEPKHSKRYGHQADAKPEYIILLSHCRALWRIFRAKMENLAG